MTYRLASSPFQSVHSPLQVMPFFRDGRDLLRSTQRVGSRCRSKGASDQEFPSADCHQEPDREPGSPVGPPSSRRACVLSLAVTHPLGKPSDRQATRTSDGSASTSPARTSGTLTAAAPVLDDYPSHFRIC